MTQICFIISKAVDYGDKEWLGIGWLGAQRLDGANPFKLGNWAWASGIPWNEKAADWKLGRPLAMTPGAVIIVSR